MTQIMDAMAEHLRSIVIFIVLETIDRFVVEQREILCGKLYNIDKQFYCDNFITAC